MRDAIWFLMQLGFFMTILVWTYWLNAVMSVRCRLGFHDWTALYLLDIQDTLVEKRPYDYCRRCRLIRVANTESEK